MNGRQVRRATDVPFPIALEEMPRVFAARFDRRKSVTAASWPTP
jgi:hypothetical protein